VTVTPSTSTSGGFFSSGGQETLTLTNPSSITALSITINVAQTTGVSSNGESNTFANGALTEGDTTSGGLITYTFTLNTGKTVPKNSSGSVTAQFNTSIFSSHNMSGDTWSVTSTSNGIVSTVTGVF
jgi:hypothetical protein